MQEIKVAIADDQSIFRQGLVNLVNSFDNVTVLYSSENGKELIEQLPAQRPDLVLLDFRMPVLNGMETTRIIREQYPEMRILILSMYDNSEFVESAIANGANGYLSKDDEPEEIAKAIYSTMEMGYYMNDRTSKMLITKMMKEGAMKPTFLSDNVQFTEMELQIIQLISEEYTTPEIAVQLIRSTRTIESLRTLIMQKIGCRNAVGIVLYALKHNLISHPTGTRMRIP